jgi:hypothetical protein
MELLSAGEVCDVLSTKKGKKKTPLPFRTLDNWCKLDIIRPSIAAKGSGRHRMFKVLPDVLAVAAGQGLRANGFEFDVAAAVMRQIMAFSEEQILHWFSENRTVLSFFGTHVLPQLSRADGVQAAIKEFEEANTSSLHPSAIDLRRLYNHIRSAIADGEQPKVRKT